MSENLKDPVYKAGVQSESNPFDFVLSTEHVDRMGDVIRASSWELRDFRSNPVALFGHDHNQVIGVWENVRVEGKQLLGSLKLAKKGTSDFIDTVRSLIEQRILKAVSVGFQPLEASPLKSGQGYEYTKSALHEVSVVAVPANPHSLAAGVAKAMNPEIAKLLFVKSDAKDGTQDPGQMTTPKLDAMRQKFTFI